LPRPRDALHGLLVQVRTSMLREDSAGNSGRSSLAASASGSDVGPAATRSGGSRSSPTASSGCAAAAAAAAVPAPACGDQARLAAACVMCYISRPSFSFARHA
jgi:hypothetical protein